VKILILKPSSLGDVVQALPVLRLIKRHWPGSCIYWWIDSGLASLLEGDPDLAGLVRFERLRWASPLNWGELWRSLQWVRQQRFDLVIDLQCLARSAGFGWLANGALTVGLDEPREAARGFYDVTVRRASFHTHAVDWYLSVLPVLKVPVSRDFVWLPARPKVAEEVRRKWLGGGERWMVIQPGARWATKCWPIESYAELLGRILAADKELRCAVLGGNDDVALGERLAVVDPARCLNLTGKTSLPEMVEWIRACELMVTNDTGPMHVAAALGKALVAVFGPTEPRRTGPYGALGNVLQLELPCTPCFRSRCFRRSEMECLRALSVSTVFGAVQQQLQAKRP
jgi:lipopolysaccharide heptosyltransferase II